jgi:hypothetical protein
MWSNVREFLNLDLGYSFISVASNWLHKEKLYSVNITSTAALRGLWLTRNYLVLNKQDWLDVKTVLRRILRLKPIFKEEKTKEEEEMVMCHLEAEQEPEIIEEIHT